MKKILSIVKSAISYLFTFFVGLYAWAFACGITGFFMILGCIACATLAFMTSPLWGYLINKR